MHVAKSLLICRRHIMGISWLVHHTVKKGIRTIIITPGLLHNPSSFACSHFSYSSALSSSAHRTLKFWSLLRCFSSLLSSLDWVNFSVGEFCRDIISILCSSIRFDEYVPPLPLPPELEVLSEDPSLCPPLAPASCTWEKLISRWNIYNADRQLDYLGNTYDWVNFALGKLASPDSLVWSTVLLETSVLWDKY